MTKKDWVSQAPIPSRIREKPGQRDGTRERKQMRQMRSPTQASLLRAPRPANDRQPNPSAEIHDLPYEGEKWPAWKVTVFVVAFCGAFWTGVAYLLTRLLG